MRARVLATSRQGTVTNVFAYFWLSLHTSTNVAIDVSAQDIEDAVTALESTVDEPGFIEMVKATPRTVITAAWQYLNQTQGHQAVTQLYQSLKNLFADSEDVWGLPEGDGQLQ